MSSKNAVSSVSNYTYGAMGSGLDGWKNIARGIRLSSRGGANYPPFNNATFIDSTKIGSYYMGAGIIAAILVICLLFTLIGGLGQCGAWTCCKSGIKAKQDKMKQKAPPSIRVKACMLVWILCIYLMFCLGAFTSYTGGAVLGNSVVSLGGVGVGMLNATGKLVNSTVPSAKSWFTSLRVTVNGGVDNSTSYVNSANLDSDGVIPALDNLATTMTTAGAGAKSLIDAGNVIAAQKTSAASLISQMITDVNSIKNTVALWQNGVTVTPGSYTPSSIASSFVNPDPSALASTASTNLDGASNVPGFLTNISLTPTSCSVCAAAVQSASDSMPTLVANKVLGQSTTVKATINTQLTNTENSLVNSLSSMRDSANSNIKEGITQLNGFSSSASTYNNSRNIVMIIMSTIILIIMVAIAFFGFRKSAKGVKGCNLASTPVYIIIQLLAVIMFIFAIMIGDVCSSVFDYTPAPIMKGLPSGGASDGVNYLMLLRDQCSANYSILTVTINMGLVKEKDIDTTQLVGAVIDAVDFSPLGDIDLSSLVVFSPDPATILTPLKDLDLSQLNASSLNTLVNNTLPALKSSLIAISTALNASTVSSTTTITGASANADYAIKKESINTLLTRYTYTGGIIDQISTLGGAISTGINSLPGQWAALNASSYGPATGYYSQSQSNMAIYQNHTSTDLKNGIPEIKTNIKSQVAAATRVLYSNLNCAAIGASLYSFQNAVCGQFLGGLDILWLAYGVIAVAAACSMPVFIWISNRLFYNNLKYVNLGQSPTSNSPGYGGFKVIPVEDGHSSAPAATKKQSIIKSFPAPISPNATSKPILPVFSKPKK